VWDALFIAKIIELRGNMGTRFVWDKNWPLLLAASSKPSIPGK
jgi:hypothetical protein